MPARFGTQNEWITSSDFSTTVPAAGYASVAAILGEWARFGESTRQLAVNLAGIVIAATVVLLLRRATWTTRDAGRPLSAG